MKGDDIAGRDFLAATVGKAGSAKIRRTTVAIDCALIPEN